MKKGFIIVLGVVLVLIVGALVWYNTSLKSISNESETVNFVVELGTGTKQVINNLKEANLIKSTSAALIYAKLNSDVSIKAGTFELNRNMSVEDIFKELSGKGISNTVRITFKEGVTLKKYVEQIATAMGQDYDKLLQEINSKEFLTPLIEKYWFLTADILESGIYYPLEGYLFPNTYEFYKDADLKSIVEKMLDETNKKLDPFKIAINDSNKSVHEILTMASIIEKEAVTDDDRSKVSQVIYKRLSIGMSLGMDVTAYYGAGKEMTEKITTAELNDNNPYNTRPTSFKGLPIGPICNPSKSSIKAALNPAKTNYIYFYAEESTKKVHFTADYDEFLSFKRIYG